MSEARKDDAGKLPLHLIDPLWLTTTAQVLDYGQKKYEAWNWAKGTFEWSRIYGALMRHMLAFWSGEELDDGPGGSGLPHLWHANCCMMFLTRYHASGWGKDDRFDFGLPVWKEPTPQGKDWINEAGTFTQEAWDSLSKVAPRITDGASLDKGLWDELKALVTQATPQGKPATDAFAVDQGGKVTYDEPPDYIPRELSDAAARDRAKARCYAESHVYPQGPTWEIAFDKLRGWHYRRRPIITNTPRAGETAEQIAVRNGYLKTSRNPYKLPDGRLIVWSQKEGWHFFPGSVNPV